MEILKYQIEDSTIAELLGRNNFTSEESAVLELVKNAYDALSSKIEIFFHENRIIIKDDGIGMNEDDIKKYWMRVGYSGKGYELEIKDKKRVLAGSKGIGRFALSRLGKEVLIESKKVDSIAIKWETNWNQSVLDYIEKQELGTVMTITELNCKWTDSKIEKLIDFLSKTYNDDQMAILIHYKDKIYNVKKYFNNPQVGKNCLTSIELKYIANDESLQYKIISDEFLDEAKDLCGDININNKTDELNIFETLKDKYELEENELKDFLVKLGDFNGKLFFFFKPIDKDMEKFLYKHKLENTLSSGVILYRNSFSISSFEGKKDWLGFGKRSRKSPAAATHPTGSWRVRENQISGYINIDKSINPELKDLSNRQGLEENEFFDLFIDIILLGIEEFEYYRQSIVRKINKKNIDIFNEINNKEFKVIDNIIQNPKNIEKLDNNEKKQLVQEIKDIKKSQETIKKEIDTSEQRYRYDVKILNVLSTLGLRAASIAHELQNDRNYIYNNIDYIIKRLKELGFWEEINDSENTKFSTWNIPLMLKENKKINIKMIEFMDTMLSDIEKEQFEIIEMNLRDEVINTIEKWKKNYSWIEFKINIEQDILLYASKDTIKVIFDNLILNSVQQNESKGSILIELNAVKCCDNFIEFEYLDNGVGLPEKFINCPMKILEVHQSSRKKGHGLGMWIINNTLNMTGGEVIEIDGHNGFKIKFRLGEK